MIEKSDDVTADFGQKALEALLDILKQTESSAAAKVSAARTLLERFHPKANVESSKREADERVEALAAARCLLAEFAELQSAGVHEPDEVVEGGAAEPADAAPEPAAAS